MTDIEEKSIRTQIELYEAIKNADSMILSGIQFACQTVLGKVIQPHIPKGDEEFVTMSLTDFEIIHQFFHNMRPSSKTLGKIYFSIDNYLHEKDIKEQILKSLQ